MPRKAIKGESSAVKIPLEMKNAIMDFLNTQKAKELGFDSFSDVVTAGTRMLLEHYGFFEKRKF
ncbi:MAG: hypothetical protein NWF08_01600 [Candidatus Bathyarchaeota archaeon]|nr:hypothetical protein [Candidatus Bathyarchaeota archaeon]